MRERIKKQYKICCILLIFCVTYVPPVLARINPNASTATLDDKSSISILTVYPRDKAIYAIFGHTAIRVKDDSLHIDWVYNYGYFDSSRPNFIYHFVKGETDYALGIDPYNNFIFSYSLDNSYVEEQILNLSPKEKNAIFAYLNNNALPENTEYRYNYFFDNCTTRPRNIVEEHVEGTIIYPEQNNQYTFRKLVRGCTAPYPWASFGIDLVLGVGSDSIIHTRDEMFLPVNLLKALDQAKVIKGNESYFLVEGTQPVLVPRLSTETATESWTITPLQASILLLSIVFIFTLIGFRKKRKFRALDFILFFSAGVAGIIVCFICFVSTHPCTSGNFNALWLHPLHIVAAVFFLLNTCKKFTYWYHLINFALLSVFMLGWYFIPQSIPIAVLPLVLSLWLRSGNGILNINKQRASKSK